MSAKNCRRIECILYMFLPFSSIFVFLCLWCAIVSRISCSMLFKNHFVKLPSVWKTTHTCRIQYMYVCSSWSVVVKNRNLAKSVFGCYRFFLSRDTILQASRMEDWESFHGVLLSHFILDIRVQSLSQKYCTYFSIIQYFVPRTLSYLQSWLCIIPSLTRFLCLWQ